MKHQKIDVRIPKEFPKTTTKKGLKLAYLRHRRGQDLDGQVVVGEGRDVQRHVV